MTYYTCDACDWAGKFSECAEHFQEAGHSAFSQREKPVTPDIPVVPPISVTPTPKCNHSFSWMSIIPPTHCPICGMYLGPIGYPYSTTTTGGTWGSSTNGTYTLRLINGGEEPPASVAS